MSENLDTDKIVKLQRKVRMKTMHTFTLTYNRHEGKYDWVTSNFPDTYKFNEPFVNFVKDPDWYYKMKPERYNFKKLFFWIALFGSGIYFSTLRVKRHDADYRKRQREALNKDLNDLEGKRVLYQLFDQNDKVFNKYGKNYVILWYDAKMVNYLNLIKDLKGKKIATDRIIPILIVDNPTHLTKVYEIKQKATTFKKGRLGVLSQQDSSQVSKNTTKLKEEFSKGFDLLCLLYKPFTDEEKLIKSFGKSKDDVFLELEKNHYYVIDENGVVVDSAKIYNFSHEQTIYQRIASRINKDMDDKRVIA